MAKRLIITADDMGYNVERNRGIIECFQRGAITNSSLMVNGIAAADAAHLALKYGLPTGLHFNITEGAPVNKSNKYTTITDKEGFFLGKQGLHLNITEGIPVNTGSPYETLTNENGHFLGMHGLPAAVQKSVINIAEVREEMNAQIKRYEELIGSKPVYVDGHQHAHIIPGLSEVFAEVLEEHHIQATRVPYEKNLKEVSWLGEPWEKILFTFSDDAARARPIFKAHNIWESDLFFGLATMGCNMSIERLQTGITRAFDSVPNLINQTVTCELMSHPGFACQGDGGCGEGPDDFSQSSDREYEKSVLESEDMAQFYKKNGIMLMSYHQCLESLK